MLGRERFDRELLDALSVCGDLIPVGSVYRFLAEHRRRVFGDGLFEPICMVAGVARRYRPR